MKLIMYLAFIESTYQTQLVFQFYLCKWDLNDIFAYTVWYNDDVYHQARATFILVYASIFASVLTIAMSQLLNAFICVDLILMVRYPFDSKEGRINKYVILSFVLAFIPAYLLAFSDYEYSMIKAGSIIWFSYICSLGLAFISSVVYTWKKLSGPGFSKEARGMILRRHIVTSLVYILTNFYLFISAYIMTFYSQDEYETFKPINTWWIKTLKIIFACQGFAIPLMRLAEPYFYKILAKNFREWWNYSKEAMK